MRQLNLILLVLLNLPINHHFGPISNVQPQQEDDQQLNGNLPELLPSVLVIQLVNVFVGLQAPPNDDPNDDVEDN